MKICSLCLRQLGQFEPVYTELGGKNVICVPCAKVKLVNQQPAQAAIQSAAVQVVQLQTFALQIFCALLQVQATLGTVDNVSTEERLDYAFVVARQIMATGHQHIVGSKIPENA